MFYIKKQKAFGLLEVMLAVIVIMVAGLGVYATFNSGINNNNLNEAANEMVEIANVYTDLSSANLTSSLTDETGLVTLLQNSDRLASSYFIAGSPDSSDSAGTEAVMVNKFGQLSFSTITPYSFMVDVPLSQKGSPVDQFCQQVNDVYADCQTTAGSATNSATLTFDLTQ